MADHLTREKDLILANDTAMEISRIRRRVEAEIAEDREFAALRSRIMSSRRIISSGPGPAEDPIVHHMVVDELMEQLPKLQRRINWLAAHRATRRRC